MKNDALLIPRERRAYQIPYEDGRLYRIFELKNIFSFKKNILGQQALVSQIIGCFIAFPTQEITSMSAFNSS